MGFYLLDRPSIEANSPAHRTRSNSVESGGVATLPLACCFAQTARIRVVDRVPIGRLADEDMVRLNRAVLVFLGIAAPKSNEHTE